LLKLNILDEQEEVLKPEIKIGNNVDENNNIKKCPRCTLDCEERLNFCPICDYSFPCLKALVGVNKDDAEYEEDITMKKCLICHQLNDKDLEVCQFCGMKMLIKPKCLDIYDKIKHEYKDGGVTKTFNDKKICSLCTFECEIKLNFCPMCDFKFPINQTQARLPSPSSSIFNIKGGAFDVEIDDEKDGTIEITDNEIEKTDIKVTGNNFYNLDSR
jgi:hypothetical protein